MSHSQDRFLSLLVLRVLHTTQPRSLRFVVSRLVTANMSHEKRTGSRESREGCIREKNLLAEKEN